MKDTDEVVMPAARSLALVLLLLLLFPPLPGYTGTVVTAIAAALLPLTAAAPHTGVKRARVQLCRSRPTSVTFAPAKPDEGNRYPMTGVAATE